MRAEGIHFSLPAKVVLSSLALTVPLIGWSEPGAKLAAAETRASPGADQSVSAGTPCRSVAVLAVWATPEAPLTVKVNGSSVGVYQDSISAPLDGFVKPGVNVIDFSYPAVPRASTEAALRCLPPGEGTSRATILLLRPKPQHLQANVQVNFIKP